MLTKIVSLVISPELYKKIKAAAKAEGRSASSFIRRAVEAALREKT